MRKDNEIYIEHDSGNIHTYIPSGLPDGCVVGFEHITMDGYTERKQWTERIETLGKYNTNMRVALQSKVQEKLHSKGITVYAIVDKKGNHTHRREKMLMTSSGQFIPNHVDVEKSEYSDELESASIVEVWVRDREVAMGG